MIVMTYRKKQQPTHFLSFPMISQAVKERFVQFKASKTTFTIFNLFWIIES